MNEYGHTGASFYDFHSLGLEGDVQFYLEEARKVDAPILEIGCGTGRILLPIAQAGKCRGRSRPFPGYVNYLAA